MAAPRPLSPEIQPTATTTLETPPSEDAITSARQTLFAQGLSIRRAVTGTAHVERSWATAPPFSRPMQELATEAGWGLIWGRTGGLDQRTRSLLNLAMLTALGKSAELAVHVRGAFRNGCSEREVQEALLQAAVYAGLPAGLEGFRVAQRVVDEMAAEEGRKAEEKEGKKT